MLETDAPPERDLSLDLIVGPPNSGRAGMVLERLRAALADDPVLIVPTGDDAARFERDLGANGHPAIGASIRTFASLVADIAAASAAPPQLSAAQRLALVRAAIGASPLRVLGRSARSIGFPGALDALIAELQGALISPGNLARAAEAMDDGSAVTEIASLYGAYCELRDRAERSDAGSLTAAAAAALRAEPAGWRSRPVFIYGFDDLTEAQLELVGLLAATAEVTVAVNYADRRALTARAGLLARLLEDHEPDVEELPFDPDYTTRESLRHLDRELFEPEAGTVPVDEGLMLLECAGQRGEAESVGLEIARLLDAGAEPGEIVVALRRPAVDGPLLASVLRQMDIPVALEAELPLGATAVGRALTKLCEAVVEDSAKALLAHLRADPSFRGETADWAERAISRGEAETPDDVFVGWKHPPVHLSRIREARGPKAQLLALAVSARELAERPHRARAPLAGEHSEGTPFDPIELRAGIAAAELLTELAAVGDLPGCEQAGLPDAVEAVESGGVRAWRGSTQGRVRIASPYRVRSARARFLFCCGLNEGVFPGRGGIDPLLGEGARSELGIAALRRAEQGDEERYLFHACVSRPTERLYLSWRASDDEGHPAPRSPFVDEVLDLIGDDPAQAEERLVRTRGLAAVVPAPAEAPTARLLARGLALTGGAELDAHRSALAELDVDMAASGDALELLASIPAPGWLPGPLQHPLVLGALSSREYLSANSLEQWLACSYQWFVSHELSPQRLEPSPDPLWLGGVVHEALDRLYRARPGDSPMPTNENLARWQKRFGELLDEVAANPEGRSHTPAREVSLARSKIQVEDFLEAEAKSPSPLRPSLLERSFGFPDEENDPGALPLGEGFALRGRIDRIDVVPGTKTALLRDYKVSKRAAGQGSLEKEGKLQLQLYLLVVREILKLDPIGGLYHPLAATGDRRGRGLLRKGEALLDDLKDRVSARGDALDQKEFDEVLEAARRTATEQGGRMRRGDIERDPLNGECSRYCTFQPICRLERAVGHDEDPGD